MSMHWNPKNELDLLEQMYEFARRDMDSPQPQVSRTSLRFEDVGEHSLHQKIVTDVSVTKGVTVPVVAHISKVERGLGEFATIAEELAVCVDEAFEQGQEQLDDFKALRSHVKRKVARDRKLGLKVEAKVYFDELHVGDGDMLETMLTIRYPRNESEMTTFTSLLLDIEEFDAGYAKMRPDIERLSRDWQGITEATA